MLAFGLLAALGITLVLSPPKPPVLVAMWLSMWIAYEIGLGATSRRRS